MTPEEIKNRCSLALRNNEFMRGQAWARKKGLDDLANLKQGDKITVRGNSPAGFCRLPIPTECRYVGLVPRQRKYPLLFLDVADEKIYRTDLAAFESEVPHD